MSDSGKFEKLPDIYSPEERYGTSNAIIEGRKTLSDLTREKILKQQAWREEAQKARDERTGRKWPPPRRMLRVEPAGGFKRVMDGGGAYIEELSDVGDTAFVRRRIRDGSLRCVAEFLDGDEPPLEGAQPTEGQPVPPPPPPPPQEGEPVPPPPPEEAQQPAE